MKESTEKPQTPTKDTELKSGQLDPNPTRDRTFILGREEEATEKDKDKSSPRPNSGPQSSNDIGLVWRRSKAQEIQAQYPECTVEEIEEMLD